MNLFDDVIVTYPKFPGYRGNPPSTEAEYLSLEWITSWDKPTWDELRQKITTLETQLPLDACKNEAKKRIAATDWAVLSDVNLANQSAFVTYRAELRTLITNPVAEPTWPVEPEPIWS
jgi:hypothetical protein